MNQCDYGYYAPGGTDDACDFCGEGYNTSTSYTDLAPAVGATSDLQCKIAAGWTMAGATIGLGIAPCTRGYYKDVLGNTSCTVCPSGTTTTITMAAVARTDCDQCRPGFGAASITLSSPQCTICPSGEYSPGYATGGAACVACPKPSLFNGLMVSRNVSPLGAPWGRRAALHCLHAGLGRTCMCMRSRSMRMHAAYTQHRRAHAAARLPP